ncbi:MAG: rod shape-determining protein RodA [Bacteroidetes bacterium]|nr:rod shape-determining protein RodA [Bacteroidota bacterium]
MRTRSNLFGPIDEVLVFILLALMLIGFGAIFTSQYEPQNWHLFDMSKNYGKQLLWIGISLSMFIFVQLIDARLIVSLSYLIYGLMIGLLLIVFVKGQSVGGNQNWINFGFFKLQPSEFVKYGTALALSRFLSRPLVRFSRLKDRMIVGAIIGLPLLLILKQGDVGSALVYVGFVFVLNRVGLPNGLIYLGLYIITISVLSLLINEYFLMGGLVLISLIIIYFNRKSRQLVYFVGIVALVSCLYIKGVDLIFNNVLKDYHRERINVMLGKVSDNAGAAYNLNQSKIAIGSGGVFGKGYLNGTQTRYDFVPELSTDFIFCTIGEELGFLGSIIVISLFVSLILRIIYLAERQRSVFNQLFMYCVASIIFMHFIINIGMTIGLAPVIGIPLPFISYGGSSLISFTLMIATVIKLDSDRLLHFR